MVVGNLFGQILAERERNEKLKKLIRMKQLLARKQSLEEEGSERIMRALSQPRGGADGGSAADGGDSGEGAL